MAHFAKIENDIVTQVIVVNNSELLIDGIEDENKGKEFCSNLLGGEWIQTSYNSKFRKQYAGLGYSYNKLLDMFIVPKCHDEAVLNEIGDWDCENESHNG